jgi:Undecaprenyl-phosphate glucose phosphotransferase
LARIPKADVEIRALSAVFICVALCEIAVGESGRDSIAWCASWFALTFCAIAQTRHLQAVLESRVVARRSLARPVVIFGSSPGALRLIEIARSMIDESIDFLGYFDDRRTRHEALEPYLPYLGDTNDLIEFAVDHDDIHVCMALPWTASARIFALLERLRFLPIAVWLAPDPDLPLLRLRQPTIFDGVVMPLLVTPPFSYWDHLSKTIFDYVMASIILTLGAPFLLAIAALIKLDSPGPVFFRQQRSGQFGRKFNIYKFRSLREADEEAAMLVSKGDPRVTRVGRHLRKYSLDELPQIINVLRGEMSLVGPRPHAPKAKANGHLYADLMPDYTLRYRIKPGMTGWAQVHGWRGETDTEEKLRKRVAFDFDYIRDWSFWLDLRILFRTIPAILFPKNNV